MSLVIENIDLYNEDKMPSMRMYTHRAGQVGKLHNMTPEVKALLRNVYQTGMRITNLQASAVHVSKQEIPEKNIPKALRGAFSYSLFYVTLSESIDAEIDRLFSDSKPLQAALLDAWGSEAVEHGAESVDRQLRKKWGPGSIRFSPGYSGFDILQNNEWLNIILQVKADSPISVSAKTGIISPRKSVLCMIGWEDPHFVTQL